MISAAMGECSWILAASLTRNGMKNDATSGQRAGRRARSAEQGPLVEQRGKLICSKCRTICETCCEGGRG